MFGQNRRAITLPNYPHVNFQTPATFVQHEAKMIRMSLKKIRFEQKLTGINELNFGQQQHGLWQRLRLRRQYRHFVLLDVDFGEADEAGHRVQDEVLRRVEEGDGQQTVGKLARARYHCHQLGLKVGKTAFWVVC